MPPRAPTMTGRRLFQPALSPLTRLVYALLTSSSVPSAMVMTRVEVPSGFGDTPKETPAGMA